VGLIVGIVLAGRFYASLAGSLSFISDESVARVAAFIIIFLLVIIIASILGVVLTKLISAVMLGWVNRLLGAIFGFFLGAFLPLLCWQLSAISLTPVLLLAIQLSPNCCLTDYLSSWVYCPQSLILCVIFSSNICQ
jgi:uncharacterized membrane protein required for colicin V production